MELRVAKSEMFVIDDSLLLWLACCVYKVNIISVSALLSWDLYEDALRPHGHLLLYVTSSITSSMYALLQLH